jgi:hypothetical protein
VAPLRQTAEDRGWQAQAPMASFVRVFQATSALWADSNSHSNESAKPVAKSSDEQGLRVKKAHHVNAPLFLAHWLAH